MSLELKAKEIIESGEIKAFEEFLQRNSDKIQINRQFNEKVGFPVVLIQTYRRSESMMVGLSYKVVVDDYKHCLRLLVEMGCNLDSQDEKGRTFAHWTILLNCLEFLAIALGLGCNSLLQDSEGETIVHLAIRHNNQMALETIKLYSSYPNVFDVPSETSGATPLIYAVQIGAVDIVRKLLQLSVNVDTQENNQYKRTALHYALFTENEEIFTLLLESKAKADIKDYKDKSVTERVADHPNDNFLRILANYSSSETSSGPPKTSDTVSSYSPIALACKNGDYSMLCNLIEKEKEVYQQVNLDVQDSDLRTPLHHCADNPDTRCAEIILELDPKLIEKKDRNGFTALHLATMANNKKLVQILLKKGSSTKEKDSEGHTALHWAVVCCATELIDLLLRTDPDIAHIVDNHGASPLHYATQSFLNPEGSVQGPIVMDKLLKNNKNLINSVDYDNRTPLLWAATLGITDCCRILLECGADKNHRDKNGLSALHCASSRGNYDVVDLLVNTWSMLVDIVDKNLCTPLFYAVTLKHMPIIHFLVNQRSNPNHQDIKGRSVAHCAALKGYCDILDLIRKVGGSLTLKNNIGDLPLHEAAETGKLEVCQLLLEKMVEDKEINQIDSVNICGLSPLHKAAQNNFDNICQLLVSKGANVNLLTSPDSRVKGAVDMSNLTPLDLATDSMTKRLLKNLKGKSSKESTSTANQDPNSTTQPIDSIEPGEDELTPKNVIQSNENQDTGSNKDATSQLALSISPFQSRDSDGKRGSASSKQSEKSNPPRKFNNEYYSRKPTSRNANDSTNKNKSFQNKRNPERSFIGKPSNSQSYNRNIMEKPQNFTQMKDNARNSNRAEIYPDKTSSSAEIQSASSGSFSLGNDPEIKQQTTGKINDKSRTPNAGRSGLVGPGIGDRKKRPTSEKLENTEQSRIFTPGKKTNNDKYDDDFNYSTKENQKINSKSFGETPHDEIHLNKEKPKQWIVDKTSNQSTPSKTGGRTTNRSDRSLQPIDNSENERYPDGKEINEKFDHDIAGNETENNSNQTASSSLSSHNSDSRKNSKSKGIDLSSKIVKSVREYESVRGQSRSKSDQKHQEMFHGYNKVYRYDKGKDTSKTPIKSDKSRRNPDQVDRQDFNLFDTEAAKKRSLFPKANSKEEQIRMAYEGQPSISTLTLYSYLP